MGYILNFKYFLYKAPVLTLDVRVPVSTLAKRGPNSLILVTVPVRDSNSQFSPVFTLVNLTPFLRTEPLEETKDSPKNFFLAILI